MPILLHGDAAFAGQGIVAETFNLYALEGYSTGGTLHLITNNQVGFTTDPAQGRSTRYSSDLAKGFDTPIVHVNADDPEAAISAVRLALAYRARFGHDIVIDLVGYRRFGHNEQDEPAYTQPIMAGQIESHPTVRELYAARLVRAGRPRRGGGPRAGRRRRGAAARGARPPARLVRAGDPGQVARRSRPAGRRHRRRDRRERQAAAAPDRAADGGSVRASRSTRSSCASSSGASPRSTRAGSTGATPSRSRSPRSLRDGVPIRLTGQDTERGTFSHRHLVLHDVVTGELEVPMQHLKNAAGVVRGLQLAALRVRLRRVRVRLLGRGARGARPLGGAVRRLRERRADDHRPVHLERAREVAADLTADAAPAARLRGERARALERPPRALPPARRRRRTSGSPTAPPRRSTSTSYAARRSTRSRARSS